MDKIIVSKSNSLSGKVNVSGAKNAALPILFSSLLVEGEHVFHNVPNLTDIRFTINLLELLNCECDFTNNTLKVNVKKLKNPKADYDIVRKMRASILCFGPLLARCGTALVSLPGGCAIGSRPIDMHLKALKNLGAKITLEKGYVLGEANKLVGTEIVFEKVSVGATENILMAAAGAEGTTVLKNSAREPEVVNLIEYLQKMGAKITGAGTSTLTIVGTDQLKPSEHTIIPDRIEAGTLLMAAAITGGEVEINNCTPGHLDAAIEKLKESGFLMEKQEKSIYLKSPKVWKAVDVETAPHPLYPTDLQAQIMTLMTQAEGISLISENIFENRFMHVQELARLGAQITLQGSLAKVKGQCALVGAPVMATDLRASASLILAGLVAEGETSVGRIYHLDRGYESLEKKLASLGGKIKRVSE